MVDGKKRMKIIKRLKEERRNVKGRDMDEDE